jgi:peptide/nickel transport system substrate-binding protein
MESRSLRLSVILLASLLVAGMLLLAACGGASKKTAAPATTQATGSTATSAALTPKYGGTLRIAALSIGANIGWPATLQGGGDLVQSYYETLLRSDAKGNLYPWLASSYKVAADKKSISFTIRKGVKFTDGSDLTAAVVKWNLEQFVNQEPSWRSEYRAGELQVLGQQSSGFLRR